MASNALRVGFEIAHDANERQRFFDRYLSFLIPYVHETGKPVLDKRLLFVPPHQSFSTRSEIGKPPDIGVKQLMWGGGAIFAPISFH